MVQKLPGRKARYPGRAVCGTCRKTKSNRARAGHRLHVPPTPPLPFPMSKPRPNGTTFAISSIEIGRWLFDDFDIPCSFPRIKLEWWLSFPLRNSLSHKKKLPTNVSRRATRHPEIFRSSRKTMAIGPSRKPERAFFEKNFPQTFYFGGGGQPIFCFMSRTKKTMQFCSKRKKRELY